MEEEWVSLPPHVLANCRAGADYTEAHTGRRSSTLALEEDREYISNCGHALFCMVTGRQIPDFLKLAKATQERRYDGGTDVDGTIDVKTSKHPNPSLLLPEYKQEGGNNCRPPSKDLRWFVVVSYNPKRNLGRVIGWATVDEAFAAPIDRTKKYPCYILRSWQLHPGDNPGGDP